MAKIIYNEGYEPLRGVYCGIEYKFRNGAGFCFAQRMPTTKEARKNPALRAERIVKLCVIRIQKQIGDMREAMRLYSAITKRVRRLYDGLCKQQKTENKLIKKILEAYYQKRQSESGQCRGNVEP